MNFQLNKKQIQEGWQIVKFGNVAREVKSVSRNPIDDGFKFYVGLDHLDPLSLRIQRRGVIADDNPSFTRLFKPGQILFGKRRCYQKKAAVANFEGICSGDIIVIENIHGKIIPELLPFIVQSDKFFEWAEKTSSGSLSPRTKWKYLVEFEFPLPPINRQNEIFNLLERIENIQIKLENSYKLGQISFDKTLNELIRRLNEKNNKIPLYEIGNTYGGLSGKQGSDFGTGEPFITYLNIYSNYEVDPNNFDYVKIKKGENQNLVKINDILFTISSETPDEVGLSSVVLRDLGTVYLNSFSFGLRLKNLDKFDPHYLKYFFRSGFFRKQVRRLAQGSTRYNLSKKEFLKIEIPVPTFNEQNEVINVLNYFSELNNTLKIKIENIGMIKNFFINSTFNGGSA